MTWAERFTAAGVLSLATGILLLVLALAFRVPALELVLSLVVIWVPLLAVAFTIIGLALLGRAIDRPPPPPGPWQTGDPPRRAP